MPPTEEEFNDKWLTPREALNAFSPNADKMALRRWILDRLKSAVTIAVARTKGIIGERPKSFVLVHPKYWALLDVYGDEHFWSYGDATFEDIEISGYGGSEVRFLDVRFDPDTLSSAARQEPETEPEPPAAALEETPAKKQALSESLLKEWSDLFARAYPNGSEALARHSVDGMFPDKHVTRSRLRLVIPNNDPGRPRKNKDLENSPKSDSE